jgi:hypothetical protein
MWNSLGDSGQCSEVGATYTSNSSIVPGPPPVLGATAPLFDPDQSNITFLKWACRKTYPVLME